jgi:hypothetical protein
VEKGVTYQLISLQLKMMSRWVIGMLMMGLLFVAAADNADAEEEKEPVADKESARTGRQYITHADPLFLGRNPSHLLDYSKQDESVVQYDPSGLGFEIQKTGVFQYQTPTGIPL